MKVAELIEILKMHDPDAVVLIDDLSGDAYLAFNEVNFMHVHTYCYGSMAHAEVTKEGTPWLWPGRISAVVIKKPY